MSFPLSDEFFSDRDQCDGGVLVAGVGLVDDLVPEARLDLSQLLALAVHEAGLHLAVRGLVLRIGDQHLLVACLQDLCQLFNGRQGPFDSTCAWSKSY